MNSLIKISQATSKKNEASRAFGIAQIQAVMDAEKAKRAANAKAHLISEQSKW
jgi:hypothetical protein